MNMIDFERFWRYTLFTTREKRKHNKNRNVKNKNGFL